ncbi:MAG: phosphate signaling complex protein PhoU [Flavobacterium sp.]
MGTFIETEIKKLGKTIKEINTLAENQVFDAMKTLLSEDDISGNKEIKKAEEKIDKLDMKIDQICQNIVALHQPVASDLRFVLSAMQIGNEAERIGDLAMSIIRRSKNNLDKKELVSKYNIAQIAREIEEITVTTNRYFRKLEEDKIEQIFALDTSLKDRIEIAIQGIIVEMKANSDIVDSGADLIIVLKHLERISDHCTNIAESVYFVITSKIVKHARFDQKK